MTTAAGGIRVERAGPVATIWLDRPAKRNAMSYAMWAALGDACAELGGDPTVRVVVLRGAGGHFCAGADIGELLAAAPAGAPTFGEVNMAAEHALATLPKPTIAYVEGDCIGGGCALAIDCDLRTGASTERGSGSPRPSSASSTRRRRSSASAACSGRPPPSCCCSPAG